MLAYEFYDPFAYKSEASRDVLGITHVSAQVGQRVITLCGVSLAGGRPTDKDNVDCITCLVLRDRFAAGAPL